MQRYGGVILLGLAVLLALFTSALLYNWLEQQRAHWQPIEPQVVSVPTENVAVATADLVWGTKLTADMIKLVSFPGESLPEGYLSMVERLHGRILITNLRPTNPS